MFIPATWMIAAKESRPGPVTAAPPSRIRPVRASSRKGFEPSRRFIAPDTPRGSNSHQVMMFRFQALTMT